MDTETRIEQSIRQAMKQRGMSTYDLARQLDVKQPSVFPIITRKSAKVPQSLLSVLHTLGLELIAVPVGEVEELALERGVATNSIEQIINRFEASNRPSGARQPVPVGTLGIDAQLEAMRERNL